MPTSLPLLALTFLAACSEATEAARVKPAPPPGHGPSMLIHNPTPTFVLLQWVTPGSVTGVDTLVIPSNGDTIRWAEGGSRTDTVPPFVSSFCSRFSLPADSVTWALVQLDPDYVGDGTTWLQAWQSVVYASSAWQRDTWFPLPGDSAWLYHAIIGAWPPSQSGGPFSVAQGC